MESKKMLTPKYQNAPHFLDYWERGNGKDLLEWASWTPNFENFSDYAPLYHEVDELGDAVVNDTYLKLPFHEANTLVKNYSENKLLPEHEAPESIKRLFSQLQTVPDWWDKELGNVGARLCMRSGTNALIVLRDFTLMGGYDYAYLGKPLIFTGALKKGAVKRLKDTLEFWVQVTRENALHINSEAYQLIVRTRLMHSYSRLSILNKAKNWDKTTWGKPINTWDMIATYTGFSLIFMQGLQKLGLQISAEEERGVFHLWKYIGFLLGIPEKYLPENRKHAVEILYLWSSMQAEGDQDSIHLAKGLLNENLVNTIYKRTIQRQLLLQLHTAMNHFLLDENINQRLQIPKPAFFARAFPPIIVNLNRLSNVILPLNKAKNYEKHVQFGSKKQMKVLEDYLIHTPKDFQY